jgi:2-polyprenyl-6-methoxyphenol hydroxylase-like FAD-dependent oxidoreductase
MNTRTDRSHAVVVGGSIAGLLAARVLADHFDHVTIVERDRLPEGPAFRRGVPHSHHLHGLMPGGRNAIESLLPGFSSELVEAGAHVVRWPYDALWLMPAGWSGRFEPRDRHRLILASRPLLEWTVRRRVLALKRVSVVEGAQVSLLVPRGGGVAGVEVLDRGDIEGSTLRQLPADLVVDASGRGSLAPDWLDALGYGRPRETVIDALLGYATRQYALPAVPDGLKGIYLMAQPPHSPRTGIMFPIEGNRWLLTLMGAGRDYPPTDEAGFLSFARSLRHPVLYQAVRDARPLTDIVGYRRTENRRRRFEKMRRWPEGFVVVGDAACAFNPVYGQGMSVAALTAVALDGALRRHPLLRGFARGFQRLVAAGSQGGWMLATGEDLRYPTTEGSRPTLMTRLVQRYMDRVIRAATVDPVANEAFVDVMTVLKPPTSVFHPRVVAAALRRHEPPAGFPTGQAAPLTVHSEVA